MPSFHDGSLCVLSPPIQLSFVTSIIPLPSFLPITRCLTIGKLLAAMQRTPCIPGRMSGEDLTSRSVHATARARYAEAVGDQREYRMVDVPGTG